jgi:hypothetical protein
MRRCIYTVGGRQVHRVAAFNWRVRKSAHSEKRLSFSEAWFRGSQLDEQGLVAYNIDPIASIFYW